MTLNWSINQARGQLTFGKLIPMAGNAYEIQLSGRVEGKTYTFYVMDESAEKCLAKSKTDAVTGAITIAFDQADLRKEFAQEWHEIRNFHTVVSDGTSTLAEGDLPVSWNPVWTEPSTGEAYSMRGPEGAWVESCRFVRTNDMGEYVFRLNFSNGLWCEFVAPRGPQGLPATAGYAYDPSDEKWHKLTVVANILGQKTLKVEQAGVEEIPADSVFMRLDSDQTVAGNKTFTGKLKAGGSTEVTVPTLADLTDSTTKAASTSWVQSLLSAFWTTAKAAAQTITGVWTFDSIVATNLSVSTLTADLTGNVTGDVTGNVTGDVTGNVTGNVTGDVTGNVTIANLTAQNNSQVDFRKTGASVLVPNASYSSDSNNAKAASIAELKKCARAYSHQYFPHTTVGLTNLTTTAVTLQYGTYGNFEEEIYVKFRNTTSGDVTVMYRENEDEWTDIILSPGESDFVFCLFTASGNKLQFKTSSGTIKYNVARY